MNNQITVRLILVFSLILAFSVVCCGQATNIKTDIQAEFPGGTSQMYGFLAKNLKYPDAAAKANATLGKTVISFIVNVDGNLEKFKILRDPGFGMAEEVIRVLKTMPKWQPAKKSGQAVNSEYILPLFACMD